MYRFRFDTGAYASHLLTIRVSSVGKMSSFHVKYIYIYTYIYVYIYRIVYGVQTNLALGTVCKGINAVHV